jgi:hypothetical protein
MRIGSLDVYDGEDWRLPAFAESELREVPRDGVVDRDLPLGVRATFTVAGLGGAVLPGLPNTVGAERWQAGGGWFLTNNVLAKVEYVTQTYDGFGPTSIFADGKFNGLMLEAVISF